MKHCACQANFNPDYFYFVTTTAVGRVHLFHQDIIKRIIVDSLQLIYFPSSSCSKS